MTNDDILDYRRDAIYLPMKIPGQAENKLVRMSSWGLDVFSYEKFPKLLSTRDADLELDDGYRFFFDYDEDLGGVPFIEIYNEKENGNYTVDFKICKSE